ncbi:Collagen alpha-5(VI) chain [Fukomys damarensis]|uniref:Collagen alpha-5(VI) chain n=1 Tax=Fukomys damarensis TaxID=885580 RepID=A0A091EBQ3_FUKDA|nr:Collagen alpha-5(VI) chain [Fukomys damarensis]
MWRFSADYLDGLQELVSSEAPLGICQRVALAVTPQLSPQFLLVPLSQRCVSEGSPIAYLINISPDIGTNGSGDSPGGNWRNLSSALRVAANPKARPTAILADLVFSTEEFSRVNFQQVVNFLKTTVNSLSIHPDLLRIGLVFYHEEPLFSLDVFQNAAQILRYLDNLPGKKRQGKDWDCFGFPEKEVFIQERGSRSGQGVQQIAVVTADDFSADIVWMASRLCRAGGHCLIGGHAAFLYRQGPGGDGHIPSWEDIGPLGIFSGSCWLALEESHILEPNGSPQPNNSSDLSSISQKLPFSSSFGSFWLPCSRLLDIVGKANSWREWKAPEGLRGPWGNREVLDLEVHRELKDYKAHRGQVEILAGKEQKEARDTKDLSASAVAFLRQVISVSASTKILLKLADSQEKCPVYPTELVFALDQSSGVTEWRFNETREIITSIVEDLHIRENNCPVGARVVVVSYNSDTNYLIRSSDYHSKKQLLQLLSQIEYQIPTGARDIGNALRFVARNVFKRTYTGANVRRVAVFFSNGQVASSSSIFTATMEMSALDISPAIFAFNERAFLDQAFGFDNTGTFQVIPMPSYREHEHLERLRRCTLCYDKCFLNTCAKEIILPENSYMDVAFLLDNSRNVAKGDFKAMKNFLISVIDNFDIASNPAVSESGDRLALLSYYRDDSRRKKGTVKTEFEFTTYDSQVLMRRHIQTSLHQLNGDATVGHGLLWAMEHLFPGTPNLRKYKVILVVSAGENHETKEFVKKVALRAKCEGYVIFVISLGSDDMEELASYPLDHHLVQLGRVHKPDLNYVVKFLKPFVYSVRRGFNQYPPPMLEDACRLISLGEDDQTSGLQFTAEIHKVSADMNSLISQKLNSVRDSPSVLEDSGGDNLVYIPGQMLEPHKLVINYEKDQELEETASFNSGHENYGRKEETDLTYEPGDASLQENYMDVAFLIDASQRIGHDEFKEVKAFIVSVLDYFYVTTDPLTSPLGDRVAVLTYSPPGYLPNTEECPVYLEFDLITYSDINQMKHHLQHSLQQLNGDVFIGHALQWTIDNIFVGTPNLRKNKVVFIISAGETNPLDKEILRNVSLRAKCQGYAIFVFSFGPLHNDKELEELASHPLDHHLVQLGRTHKPDLDYIIKFIKPFVHLIRRAINKYPDNDLKAKCANITFPSPENVGTENTVLLIPEVYEIETEDSELFGHLGSQEQHFFELGDNSSNSGIATDLTQKSYMLFLPGEVMLNDKEEAYSKEIIAPGNDKQQGEKESWKLKLE